jgi:hypothetical protein
MMASAERQNRMPRRLIGIVPLSVGGLGLIGMIATANDPGTGYRLLEWAIGPLLLVLGLGLFFSKRWAWAIAVLIGVIGLMLGAIALVIGSGDITNPGAETSVVIFYLGPGAALLATLLRRDTLRWVQHREDVSAPPPRPD